MAIMEAGRELDALVAEKVMGTLRISNYVWFRGELCWPVSKTLPSRGGRIGIKPLDHRQLRPYSTDIAAAWEVVEKAGLCVWPTKDNKWFVHPDRFDTSNEHGNEYWFAGDPFEDDNVVADTAPHAICLAALKAVE